MIAWLAEEAIMNIRLKAALVVIAAALISNAAMAAPSSPWCPIDHVPWFLPCK
jgi:hypothetical protein